MCNSPAGRTAKLNSQTPISDSRTASYVLVVYQPGSRHDVRWWRISPRPWVSIRRGQSIGDRRRRLRVVDLRRTTSTQPDCIRHFLHVYTKLDGLSRTVFHGVAVLPRGRKSAIADFLRYHVLIRVFDGDADRWLDHIRRQGDYPDDDVRFVRWIRGRLRREPGLMNDIRKMVERMPLWQA